MVTFFRNIFLFILPIFALFAIPILIFVMSGEATPFRDVAALGQGTTTVLFGRAYSDVDRNFKIAAQKLRGAKLVILGSSRTMYTRREFFRPEVDFYNAGGAARRPEDLTYFLANLPEDKKPSFIIVGLDQRWFMSDFSQPDTDTSIDSDAAWTQFFGYAWKQIYADYASGKFSLNTVFGAPAGGRFVGLNAKARGNGFRNDGSYRSGQFLSDPNNVKKARDGINDVVARIRDSSYNFDYTVNLNGQSLGQVADFLDLCAREGITVIGYLSPYAGVIYEQINDAPQSVKESRDNLDKTLQGLFRAHSFVFYDLSDPRRFGGVDEEFIDAWHGSDKTFARMYLWLGERDITIRSLVNVPRITKALSESPDTYQVFID